VAESCTGTGAACPADAFQPATTICRPSQNECDEADSCTGLGVTCPGVVDECRFREEPQITPTGTTCQQYRDFTSLDLAAVQYLRRGDQPITSSNPGVFFLYDGLHLAGTGNITVTETNGPPAQSWTRRLPLQGSQVILYDLNCNVVLNFSNNPGGLIFDAFGNLTIPDVPAGDYFLSVKYNANVAGCTIGDCPDTGTTYTFSVGAGGSSSGSDSVQYVKKP
jgi:hypothetical protein